MSLTNDMTVHFTCQFCKLFCCSNLIRILFRSCLLYTSEQQQAEQPAAETVYVTTKVNIRDAASTDGNVVEMLEFGKMCIRDRS